MKLFRGLLLNTLLVIFFLIPINNTPANGELPPWHPPIDDGNDKPPSLDKPNEPGSSEEACNIPDGVPLDPNICTNIPYGRNPNEICDACIKCDTGTEGKCEGSNGTVVLCPDKCNICVNEKCNEFCQNHIITPGTSGQCREDDGKCECSNGEVF